MTTVFVGSVAMMKHQGAPPTRYPKEFETWVRHQHRLWENIQRNAESTFKGVQLHVVAREGWEGIAHPFAPDFERFLNKGLKELRLNREVAWTWQETYDHYQRVEEAIDWLQQQDGTLARVLLFYQEPFRKDSVINLAQDLKVNQDEPRRLLKRALRHVWWYIGQVW